MIRVALTGGIGAGKSTVAAMFQQLSVPIIDADVISARIFCSKEAEIKKIFLEQYGLQGDNFRQVLRQYIFKHHEARMTLEHLLHRDIWLAIEDEINALATPWVIVVIPLLIEYQLQNIFDKIIVVDADESLQVSRVMARDAVAMDEVQALMQVQTTREARLAHADIVIDNHGDFNRLNSEVQRVYHMICRLIPPSK